MKTYKMLSTRTGSRDGLKVETFNKGETYPLNPDLAEQFYHLGAVEEVSGIQPRELADGETLTEGDLPANAKVKKGAAVNPADLRDTKVTGPTETKIVTPDETKEGEAGVELDTQNIEELVALARDTYGLEVDSTMSEQDLRVLIEQAESEDTEGDDAKDTKKAKKKGKK